MSSALRVLHVSSEVFPFSRTGGLADVLDALPRSLARQGVEVTVLSPWYRDIEPEPHKVMEFGEVHVGEATRDGVRHLFLGLPEFDRPGVYGPDDVWRFIRFGRAVFPTLDAMGLSFDLLHAHDWSAALLCRLARDRQLRSVFTVHNLQYQGRWNGADAFGWTGLPAEDYGPGSFEYFGDVNLMKGGLIHADVVTTVSPTYAREITTPEFGEGLDGVLRSRYAQGQLFGILNGLDQERWDPRTDPHIKAYKSFRGKAANQKALRQELGLRGKPVLAAVTRLVEQKGIDLLVEALPELTPDWDVVVLGAGDPRLESALAAWEGRGVWLRRGMDEALAHRIYAGAHAYVMPSRFEPCGLSQMIAMRYGTLPLVRDTGGLHDSVPKDVGFVFGRESVSALVRAARTARKALEDEAAWRERAERGMSLDFAWENAAQQYVSLYQRVLNPPAAKVRTKTRAARR